MAQPKTVIASRACHDCGERVQIKLNKNYLAYYYCGCGASHRFNRQVSAELDAKYERMYGVKDDDQNSSNAGGVRATGGTADSEETGQEATSESAPEKHTEEDQQQTTRDTERASEDGIDTAAISATRSSAGASGGDWLDDLYG